MCHPREGGVPLGRGCFPGNNGSERVNAGIAAPSYALWIPAFAGMTICKFCISIITHKSQTECNTTLAVERQNFESFAAFDAHGAKMALIQAKYRVDAMSFR